MGFADLHIHTTHSWDGTFTVRALLEHTAQHTPLGVLAVTDHDQLRGALEAQQMAPAYGLEVIPGCEISTSEGHLLAYFLHKPVPAGLPLEITALMVGNQGGLCAPAHPDNKADGIPAVAVRRALKDPDVAGVMLGVEAYNAGLIYRGSNRLASKLANECRLAALGSSDAHMLWMVGLGMTAFEGWTAQDLRRAMETRSTRVIRRPLVSRLALISGWVTGYMLRKIGWVTAAPGILARLEA